VRGVQEITPIEYTVSLEAPQTQTARIQMVVRNIAGDALDVALPVWRPGRYAVINPAGALHSLSARRGSGLALPVTKIDKTTWRVETRGVDEVEIAYTLYANSLADRTRHIDNTHAFLSGAAVFLYAPDRRDDPVAVHIHAPSGWKAATGLERAAEDPWTFLAANYDVLIDSPIEAGLHDSLSFEVDGVPHEIILWGAARYDGEKLKRDFAKIVKAQAELFGTIPYHRYVFLLHIGSGLGGGTEHLNSTIMQTSPRAFEDEDAYQRLLALASHEMFHTWNVKRLRPAALQRLDLSRENYTDLLWFCEGATSYYDELMVVRAGLNHPDAYLARLSEDIHQLRNRPGASVQSLAESSFDAWIKFNHPTPDDLNSTVSFYDNGALFSLLWDLELRKRTAGRATLDMLMREMYTMFPASGAGFTTADLIETSGRLSGTSFDAFFEKYVYGTAAYPFEEVAGVVGLHLGMDPGKNGRSVKPRLGLNLYDVNGGAGVRAVLSDGPAYAAGVLPGDEIVALNGRRFSSTELVNYVDGILSPGDRVELHVMRRNRLHVIEFELGSAPGGRWRLTRAANPTTEQKLAYSSWLNHPWPEAS